MRAKRPVSVGGIEFDALIDEELSLESIIPAYAVEEGFAISDSIILNPEKLKMTLYVTGTPITWRDRHDEDGRVEKVCKKLEELYFARSPVKIITSDRTYRDMAIETISFRKSADVGYAREIPISFQKINVTSAKTTTIPDFYGKSGATGASAGSANVTQGDSADDKEKANRSVLDGIASWGMDTLSNGFVVGGANLGWPGIGEGLYE